MLKFDNSKGVQYILMWLETRLSPSRVLRIDMPSAPFLKYFLAPHCSGTARTNRVCPLLQILTYD
jgi:hypothetical protein